MLFNRPLDFVSGFIDDLDKALRKATPEGLGLSKCQRCWLGVCVMGVIVTNSLCWRRFARAYVGRYAASALCWMFLHAAIAWDNLLAASVEVVLQSHGITEGTLLLDDTDKRRSKRTKRIAYTSKLKDKSTGGYVNGQCLVFLVLATPTVTLPVGFAFYQPDPARTKWAKKDKQLKKRGVVKSARPPEPPHNPAYPTKPELALRLLMEFKQAHQDVKVKAVLADALYGTSAFLDEAAVVFDVQVISQLHSDQIVQSRSGQQLSLAKYFARRSGVPGKLSIRGCEQKDVVVDSARLRVRCHGKKRFIIALKYDGEQDYRYLVATNLTWRTEDIVKAYTLRWLAEVFFQDWKAHEGWGTLTKQRDEEGSSRSLILSLLVDHCLLMHPDQLAQLEHNLPAFTVGSLVNRVKVQSLLMVIQDLIASGDPQRQLEKMAAALNERFDLKPSGKHMVGRDLGRQEPTPSLKYRAVLV